MNVGGAHDERPHDRGLGGGESVPQVRFRKLVHQEADRAAVHAEDRLLAAHEAVQHLQHQAVAAKRDDDVGVLRPGIAVARDQQVERGARLRRCPDRFPPRSGRAGDHGGGHGVDVDMLSRFIPRAEPGNAVRRPKF